MKQIIYLEQKDNIATIRDKLERAQSNEVLLVVPSRYPVLRDLVNLKLLKRYAQHLAIDLALVVKDRPTQVLAREVGFVLVSSVEKGRTISLRGRRRRRAVAVGAGAEGAESELAQAPERRARPALVSREQQNILLRLLALLVLFAGLAFLVIGFVYLVLPAATVTLVPAVELVETAMEITAVPGLGGIDYGQGQIPATTLSTEAEGMASTPATAMRDIPDAHAEGEIVFANKTNAPVKIPKGTFVRTSAGAPIRFYTVTDLELPGTWGAHARVGIIAVEAGPAGNVKRLTINQVEGELAFQVDAVNDEPTHGGGVKRVTAVTAEDMVRVKNALLQRLHQEAYTKLQAKLSGNEFIPADTVTMEIIEEKYDRAVGEIAENVSLQLRVRATGTLVGGEEANTLILRMLERQVREGYALAPESLLFQPAELIQESKTLTGTVTAAAKNRAVRFRMKASGLAVCQIKEAEVRSGIAGKPIEEARQYLLDRWDFEESPRLEVTPEWLGRVPWAPYRISVNIVQPEAPARKQP